MSGGLTVLLLFFFYVLYPLFTWFLGKGGVTSLLVDRYRTLTLFSILFAAIAFYLLQRAWLSAMARMALCSGMSLVFFLFRVEEEEYPFCGRCRVRYP